MKSETRIPESFYIGLIKRSDYEMMRDAALCRFNVKTSKRVHISAIVDETIKLLMEKQIL